MKNRSIALLTVGAVGVLSFGASALSQASTISSPAPVVHHTAPAKVSPVVDPAPTAAPDPAPAVAPAPVATTPAPTTTQAAPSAPAPVQATVPAASPVASPIVGPPTTSTTTPPLTDGPQPVGPSVTTQITNCYVSWDTTQADPQTGLPTAVHGAYGGDCGEAQALAAEHPGSTVTEVTNPVTTSPGS